MTQNMGQPPKSSYYKVEKRAAAAVKAISVKPEALGVR
jgi:hypothetical protein